MQMKFALVEQKRQSGTYVNYWRLKCFVFRKKSGGFAVFPEFFELESRKMCP